MCSVGMTYKCVCKKLTSYIQAIKQDYHLLPKKALRENASNMFPITGEVQYKTSINVWVNANTSTAISELNDFLLENIVGVIPKSNCIKRN